MRRTTLAGLAGLTLAVALIALALLVGGAAGGHGKGKGHSNSNASSNHGRIGFHFLVADQVAGTTDRMKWKPIRPWLLEALLRSEEHTSELQSRGHLVC